MQVKKIEFFSVKIILGCLIHLFTEWLLNISAVLFWCRINNNVPTYLVAEEFVIGRFHFIFLRYYFFKFKLPDDGV